MDNSSTWTLSTDVYLSWDNAATDQPVAGDWNMDGRTETGVYRPGAGFYLKMDNSSTWTPSTDVYLSWDNAATDRPVAGDWNADGRTETGVYRPGAGFYLKMDSTTPGTRRPMYTWRGTTHRGTCHWQVTLFNRTRHAKTITHFLFIPVASSRIAALPGVSFPDCTPSPVMTGSGSIPVNPQGIAGKLVHPPSLVPCTRALHLLIWI